MIMNGNTKPVPSIERKFPARNSRVLPESRGLISSLLCLESLFHALLVPVEMVSASRGTPLGGSAPSRAALVGVIDQTLSVDFGKFSETE
jgi:hypothetical protein